MENKMADVAKLLGVELGEEFDIERSISNPYKITSGGLEDGYGNIAPTIFSNIIKNPNVIKKRPFKPKKVELYWFIDSDGEARYSENVKLPIDYYRVSLGNCYRTKEEAKEHAREWFDKMRTFWNETK